MSAPVEKEGWLWKRGGQDGRSGKRRRWFVLRGEHLKYYEKQGERKEKGVILLSELTGVGGKDHTTFGFLVVTTYRTFYLFAENEDSFRGWLDVLESRLAAKPAKDASLARLRLKSALGVIRDQVKEKRQKELITDLETQLTDTREQLSVARSELSRLTEDVEEAQAEYQTQLGSLQAGLASSKEELFATQDKLRVCEQEREARETALGLAAAEHERGRADAEARAVALQRDVDAAREAQRAAEAHSERLAGAMEAERRRAADAQALVDAGAEIADAVRAQLAQLRAALAAAERERDVAVARAGAAEQLAGTRFSELSSERTGRVAAERKLARLVPALVSAKHEVLSLKKLCVREHDRRMQLEASVSQGGEKVGALRQSMDQLFDRSADLRGALVNIASAMESAEAHLQDVSTDAPAASDPSAPTAP